MPRTTTTPLHTVGQHLEKLLPAGAQYVLIVLDKDGGAVRWRSKGSRKRMRAMATEVLTQLRGDEVVITPHKVRLISK